MLEDLTGITSIQFPTLTNTSADISLLFGSMTPMIEIPSTIILRQLEEGTVIALIFTGRYFHEFHEKVSNS